MTCFILLCVQFLIFKLADFNLLGMLSLTMFEVYKRLDAEWVNFQQTSSVFYAK